MSRTSALGRKIVEQPRTVLVLVSWVLVVAVAVTLGTITYRSSRRIEGIAARLQDTGRIQSMRLGLQRSLLDEYRGLVPTRSFLAEDLKLQVAQAAALGPYLDPRTADRLRELQVLLSGSPVVPRETLIEALDLLRQISDAETAAQGQLLERIRADARRELGLTVGVFLVLALLTLAGARVLSRGVLRPLVELRELLSRLAEGEYPTVSEGNTDPVLVPLFENYNKLVARLEELEEEHRSRAATLEREVRAAAEALLEQHRTLANAERLAAVGATAAGVAHELRNPLAGILMAMENLKREVSDPGLASRIESLVSETQRVTRLLNDYLSSAQHAPEPARRTDVSSLVRDLVGLLQYQAPAGVDLVVDVPEGLECVIPRDRVRQALLNLVVNSIVAMRERRGSIVISASLDAGTLALSVCDDGPGLPGNILGGDLRPFATGRESGTGLGLVMVRRLANDLNGSLSLGNRETGGACVSLNLPCQNV